MFHCHDSSGACTIFLQCLWRCYAAEPRSQFGATWSVHVQPNHSHHLSSTLSKVARRASANFVKVKRRRTCKSTLEPLTTTNFTSHDNHIIPGDENRKGSDDSTGGFYNDPKCGMSSSHSYAFIHCHIRC